MERLVRPTVLLAYGAEGVRWLRQMRADLSAASLGEWFERGVWQCWAVGAKCDDPGILTCAPQDADFVRHHLERARPADLVFDKPHFLTRSVLVVERVSVLSPDSAPRTALRSTLESVRVASGIDRAASFDLLWLAFADAVHGANSPDRASHAQRFFASPGPQRTFLVDRLTQNNAIVQPDIADWVLQELATCALTSDLLLPPALEGNVARLPEFDEAAQHGHVTAVGLVLFRHDERVRQRMLAAQLEQQFRNGTESTVTESLLDEWRNSRSLTELVTDDLSALKPISSREDREAALKAFFTKHLARNSWEEASEEIEVAMRQTRGTVVAPTLRAVDGLALALDPRLLQAGAAGLLLVSAIIGVWLHRRSRPRTGSATEFFLADSRDRTACAEEWHRLLGRCESLVIRLREILQHDAHTGAREVWKRGATSFDWIYDARAERDSTPATSVAVKSMRDQLTRWILKPSAGEDTKTALDSALQATAVALVRHDAGIDASLRTRVIASIASEFEERLPNLRPMARGSAEDHRAEVVWLTPAPEKDSDAIRRSERGAQAANFRVLSTQRTGVTARVVLGSTVPWGTITSLEAFASHSH